MNLHIVSEDLLSDAVSRKLFSELFPDVEFIFISNVKRGCGNIKNKVNSYNRAANKMHVFILVDLDTASCAPLLLENWFQGPLRECLIFRVAVREVESWLLADVEGLTRFLDLKKDFIRKETKNPDSLADPKAKLLALVTRCKKRELKKMLSGLKTAC